MIPKKLVPVYNSENIQPDLFPDAFGVSEEAIVAIVERLRQECPGRMVTNGDIEQVLLQFYALDEGPEGRSLDDIFAGKEEVLWQAETE